MAKGNTLKWIIGSVVLIGAGVGAYFLFRPKSDEDEDFNIETDVNNTSTTSTGISIPNELNSTDKVKDFQKFVFYTKKDKSLATSKVADGVDGIYGRKTSQAWAKYKDEYLKKPNQVVTSQPSAKDIDTIINSASGNKAQRTYLNKSNPVFVSNWATAIRNKRTAFAWQGQVYSVSRGEVVLGFNPLNKIVYAKKTGMFRKSDAKDSSTGYNVRKGEEIGVVEGFKITDGKLFLYVPKYPSGNLSNYKWIYATAITTQKPSSSFDGDGVNNFEPTSSFDYFEPTFK